MENFQFINKDSLIDKGKNERSIELQIVSSIEVQTTNIKPYQNSSVSTNKMSMINKATQVYEEHIIPKENHENSKIMIRRDHVTRISYQHPNHKSRHCNRLMYKHHYEHIQHLNYILNKFNSSAIWSQNSSLSWNHNTKSYIQELYKLILPLKIELRWTDPSIIQQLCSIL